MPVGIYNLPTFPTPFVGRQDELAEITRLLHDPACRLLTLIGPGGIGKTRLALEAARPLVFAHGVHLIQLQPLLSADLIIPTIAEALNIQFHSGAEPRQQLLDYFHEKSLLLILDNFEDLLEGVEVVGEILAHAPGVHVLVTSRERLNLLGEWALEIPGLAFPANVTEAEIENYGAVQLFLQNAQRVQVGFTLSEGQKPAVSRICQLVGGMPLGIELAAAWVRSLSCEEIAREIEHSVDILETSARNMPPRHRNMRAVFEPTWKRLSAEEQDVFKALSVFCGCFSREAAGVIADGSVRTLTGLVDRSLLRLDANGRYTVHELLRQYGEEQLAQMPAERDRRHDLQAAYFADFMEQQWGHLMFRRQKEALAEIDAYIDNIRAAWRYSVQQRHALEMRKFINTLWFIYDLRGWYYQGIELFTQAAEALRSVQGDEEIDATLAQVLAVQGYWTGVIGFPERGLPLAEEGLAILRRLNRRAETLLPLQAIWINNWYLNAPDMELLAVEEWLAVARENNDQRNIALALQTAFRVMEPAEARPMLEEAVRMLEELGEFWGMSVANFALGTTLWKLGETDKAKHHSLQAVKAAQEIHFRAGQHHAYHTIANIAFANQQFDEAAHYYRLCLKISHEVGLNRDTLETVYEFARLLAVQGRRAEAVELLTLVLHHPVHNFSREAAQLLFDELQTAGTPEVPSTVFEGSKTLELEKVVTKLLENDHLSEVSAPALEVANEANHALSEPLSERELEVLRLVASGLSNNEIAERLVVGVSTIKTHINHIYGKLDVATRTQAILQAQKIRLI